MLRILTISAALAAVGAVAGAVGSCLYLGLAMIIYGRPEFFDLGWLFAIATGLGAACGVFVAPILSWTMLRHVPVWRCATETALAATFVGLWAINLTTPNLWLGIGIALIAAALAAARLKWAFRRRPAAEPEMAA